HRIEVRRNDDSGSRKTARALANNIAFSIDANSLESQLRKSSLDVAGPRAFFEGRRRNLAYTDELFFDLSAGGVYVAEGALDLRPPQKVGFQLPSHRVRPL